MREAEVAVVWDAFLGGRPVSMIGIESRPLARFGSVPADGPERLDLGHAVPAGLARRSRARSTRPPGAGRSSCSPTSPGFDGSPESMRRLQLEYGAEIGRAIVNFDGPIVFCVISRFHGGAFVVFSRRLNPSLETIALEGSHASVIGGAPAAAVVFAREVDCAHARGPADRRRRAARGRGALRRGPLGEAGRAGRRVRRHPQRRARGRGRLRRPHHRRRRAAAAPDRRGRARDRARPPRGSPRGGRLIRCQVASPPASRRRTTSTAPPAPIRTMASRLPAPRPTSAQSMPSAIGCGAARGLDHDDLGRVARPRARWRRRWCPACGGPPAASAGPPAASARRGREARPRRRGRPRP